MSDLRRGGPWSVEDPAELVFPLECIDDVNVLDQRGYLVAACADRASAANVRIICNGTHKHYKEAKRLQRVLDALQMQITKLTRVARNVGIGEDD